METKRAEARSRVGRSAGYSAKKSFLISAIVVLVAGICATAEAKSVYAITNHGAETITAYQIQGNQLEFPSANSFNHDELINVTVDSQRKLLFVTVEGGGVFCVDADTLNEKGYSSTPCELAGIVADELRQKIYAVGRQTNQLYIYTWDGNAFALIQQVTLANLGGEGAYGIALDKISRRLYVANNTAMVQYYDVDDPDWAHLGSCNVGHAAMDVDVDSYRGYLYVGGYQESGSGYNYLIKHDLESEPNSNTEQDIGTMVVGVAVDPVSGLVYVTTWNGQVRVYDCSGYPFIQTYSVTNGAGPAGICVESSGISFTKDDDLDDENPSDCRSPEQELTYTIRWENTSGMTLMDVSIIDTLPAGVNFDDFVEGVAYQPEAAPTANPNVIYSITDANDLTDIILPVGQSIRLYLTKETFEEDVLSFCLEADISDPNLGWIDNTEYDPNNPGTAEILAQPRASFFDYYGPGYTQPEGIQFFAANLGNAIQDGNLASFVYTATQPGYVVLTLVDYSTNPATLEEMIIRQVDPNDPNYVPEEPEESEEPPAYSASSVSGVSNEPNHTVIWELGDIAPGDYGSVSFSVIVNENAAPGSDLHNVAELWADILVPDPNDPNIVYPETRIVAIATKDTRVCCYIPMPEELFVDKNATEGANSGLDWPNAFTDLQSALEYARSAVCGNVQSIYVAQGTYSPQDTENGFVLPENISLYGGFPTDGCDFADRNPKKYVTTLTGLIDEDDIPDVDTIVSMGNNTLLDGFTITKAAQYGVYGSGVDFTIENSTIEMSDNYGIRAINGNVSLKWDIVRKNKWDGIRHSGAGFTLNIDNCWIMKNLQHGIYCTESTPVIRNSIVSESDLSEAGNEGIRIVNPTTMPVLFNNTFAHNKSAGIFFTDNGTLSDPNDKDYPDVQNCILWYNNNGGSQLTGFSKEYIYHSCIYDPNDPNGVDLTPDVNYNFTANPQFAYFDPNNVHIAFDSPCKDAGNTLMSYDDQVDMDNKERVEGAAVDMGAYEVDCSDVSNPLDWNADGRINLFEFNYFSRAWLTYDPNNPLCDPNNPNYVGDPNAPGYISQLDKERFNPACDLDSDLDVDLGDLMAFCEDAPQIWLWKACWITEEYFSEMMAGGGESMLALSGPVLSGVEGMVASVPPETFQPVEAVSVAPVKIIPAEKTVQPVETVEPEKSIAEQIADLQDSIEFLESIWSENPDIIDPNDWQRFMDSVSQSMSDLQTESVQIE